MGLPSLQVRQYPIEVFTTQYLFSCVLEPLGTLIPFLNNPERRNLPLKNVKATSLDSNYTVSSFTAEEIYAPRDEIIAIKFINPITPNTMTLLPFKDKLRVFMPHIVVQASFAHGQDTRLTGIFESMVGMWAPAENARIYMLHPIKATVSTEAQMILLNKHRIQTYQLVP